MRGDFVSNIPFVAWQHLPRSLPPSASIVPSHQPSQRYDSLPDFWQGGVPWQTFRQTIVVAPFLWPGRSQRYDSPPVYDCSWWEPIPRHVLPPSASRVPTSQPSQRFDPLPDFNFQTSLYARHALPPSVATTVLPSQRFDPVPSYEHSFWDRFPKIFSFRPLPIPPVTDDSVEFAYLVGDALNFQLTVTYDTLNFQFTVSDSHNFRYLF
jgi:hypothetical protein